MKIYFHWIATVAPVWMSVILIDLFPSCPFLIGMVGGMVSMLVYLVARP